MKSGTVQMLINFAVRGVLTLWMFMFSYCGSGEELAGDGSGTQTGNPSIVGLAVDSIGNPVKNAEVKLRRSDYLSPIAQVLAKMGTDKINGTTDVNGYFSFDSVDSGTYTIEISDEKKTSVAVSVEFNGEGSLNLDTLALAFNGVVKGYVPAYMRPDSIYYMQVFGLERLTAVDPATGYFAFEDLPEGIYDLRMAVSDSDSTDILFPKVKASPGEEQFLSFFEEWQHRALISLPLDSLTLPSEETVYNFPLLLRLSSENFDFSEARPEGEDIRFISLEEKELEFEVEFWDVTTAMGIVWIKINSLSPTSKNEFYMLWGNPDGKSRENSFAVFDTSNGFEAVWHMGQSGGETMSDATFNQFTGLPTGMDGSSDVIGAIGRSQIFDGANTFINVENSAESSLDFSYPESYSISAWVYPDSGSQSYQTILSKGLESFGLYLDSTGSWEYREFLAEDISDTLVSNGEVGNWSYVSISRRDSLLEFYVNGSKAGQKITSASDILKDRSLDVTLGVGGEKDSLWFSGQIDEVRMSSTFRSSAWFMLCYETQKIGQSIVSFEKIK